MRPQTLGRIAGWVIAASLSAGAVGLQSPRDVFERAKMLDNSNRNLGEAIKLYNQVIGEAAGHRVLAAEAQYRLGLIYNRLGKTGKAQQAFKAVVSQYPEQADLVALARKKIAPGSAGAKKEPEFVVKKTGPLADGLYLATFTFPGLAVDGLLHAVVDADRHRLYITASRIRQPGDDAASRRAQRKGLRYVYEPSTLVVIDTDTNSVVKATPLSVYASVIGLNALTGKLYASAVVDGHVRVIDLKTFSQTRIPIPGYPSGGDVNPTTNKVYVTSQGFAGNDKLFAIDGASNAVAGPFDLDGVPGELAVNSATNRIYAATEVKTRVFNGADNTVMGDLAGIRVIGADPIHNWVYAEASKDGKITALQVLDGNTHNVLASFDFGADNLGGFSVAGSVDRLYVASFQTGQMAVIDTATLTEMGRLSIDAHTLALDHSTKRIYVLPHREPGVIRVLATSVFEEQIPDEFIDSFDSTTLDPAWTVLGGQGSYSLAEHPGYLRFHVAVPHGPNSPLLLVRRFRGDTWTLEIKVSYFTGTSGSTRNLRFVVGFGAPPPTGGGLQGSGVYIERQRIDWNGSDPGVVGYQFVEDSAKPPPSPASFPVNAADSYVWRIKRNGRTVSVERSDDGTNFTVVGTRTFGSQIDGVIQFLGLTYFTFENNEAYADYDYAKLTRAAPVSR